MSVPPLQNPHYVAALETPANKTIAIHLADVSDLIAYGRSIGPVRGNLLLCAKHLSVTAIVAWMADVDDGRCPSGSILTLGARG